MNLNKDPESWALVKPDVVYSLGELHVLVILEMALHDIAALHAEVERLRADLAIAKSLFAVLAK